MRKKFQNMVLLGVMLLSMTPVSAYAQGGVRADEQIRQLELELIFPCNTWEVHPTSEFQYQVDSVLLPLLRDSAWRIDHLEISGAASPEGSLQRNRLLAKKRKEAMLEYLNSLLPAKYQLDYEMMRSVVEVPEDYARLARNMRSDGDPYADMVQTIVDTCGGDEERTKNAIRYCYNGLLWNYLYRTYFAQLRASHLVIYLSPVDEMVVDNSLAIRRPVFPTLSFVPRPIMPVTSLVQDTTPEVPYNRPAVLSIKTNLLFDFAYVPKYGMAYILNAQIEYYPKRGHFTPVLSFDGPWWSRPNEQKFFQVRNYQGEFRWYIRREQARYDGFYLGAYGHGMLYSVGFNESEGYMGEGWGVGISAGYVLPLIKNYKHLKIEFGLQVGYFHTKYDPYVYGCPVEKVQDGQYYYDWTGKAEDFVRRQYVWNWFGPTRVGITVTYDLLYRRLKKKGISFIWHEKKEE